MHVPRKGVWLQDKVPSHTHSRRDSTRNSPAQPSPQRPQSRRRLDTAWAGMLQGSLRLGKDFSIDSRKGTGHERTRVPLQRVGSDTARGGWICSRPPRWELREVGPDLGWAVVHGVVFASGDLDMRIVESQRQRKDKRKWHFGCRKYISAPVPGSSGSIAGTPCRVD